VSALRLVIVDDEPVARAGVNHLLASDPEVEIVGEAGDVGEAVAAIMDCRPDAVLLDIQLPSGTGFDVLAQLDEVPPIAFITAHHHHAVEAFELAAVDYLLKPFAPERLQLAITRLREAARSREADRALQLATAHTLFTRETPLDRLYVRRGRRILMLPVAAITRIEADGMYTRVITSQETHIVTVSLTALAERLPGDQFLRVHRSHIVRLDAVTGFTSLPSGRLQVDLRDGTTIPCSREHAREIRQRAM
jgi:two-component system, LytTR family, response regulator